MALIVLLRGFNVGGYRTLHPSMLAKELGTYDVVNVGAAGTLVVRKPGYAHSSLRSCAESSQLRLWLRYAMAVISSVWRWTIRSEMNGHARILSNS